MRFSFSTDHRRRLTYPYRLIDGGRRIDKSKRLKVIYGLICSSIPLWLMVLCCVGSGYKSPEMGGVGIVGGDMVVVSDGRSREERLRDSAVMRWLRYFTDKDFGGCDSLVKNTTHRLLGFGDDRLYMGLLDGVVSSLRKVSVERIVETESGFRFTLRVEFKPYKAISSKDMLYPEGKIEELQRGYLSNEIDDADIEGYLEDIYYDVFQKNCFLDNNGDVVYDLIDLSEENGYVYGTVDFVNMLLDRTNLIHNMRTYGSSVKEGIDDLLEDNVKSLITGITSGGEGE